MKVRYTGKTPTILILSVEKNIFRNKLTSCENTKPEFVVKSKVLQCFMHKCKM